MILDFKGGGLEVFVPIVIFYTTLIFGFKKPDQQSYYSGILRTFFPEVILNNA